MEKLKINANKENPFIKKNSKHKISDIKMKKRKSLVGDSKQNKLTPNKDRRGTIFAQQTIRPISITFRKAPHTIDLIKYIKIYKEMHLKKNNDSDDQHNVVKKHLITKIITLLKSHRGLYDFFNFYQISEKAILRLARSLHFIQKEKNEFFWYENDISNKIYFLLKGKLSFRKYVNTPYEREVLQKDENNIFGMNDIVYDRKRKLSCITLEECSCLYFSKDIFKLYMEESVNKVISERKKFLLKFFNEYSGLSPAKIERYISNSVEDLFYRKNDIIFREGEKNISLYLIFNGEANLMININKNFFDSLPNFNLPIQKIKENARNIDYGKIIGNCKREMEKLSDDIIDDRLDINSCKVISTFSKGSIGGMEISTGITTFKYNLVCNSNFCAVIRIKLELFEDEHLKNLMVNLLPYFISKEKKIHKMIQNIKYIDHNINPPSCQKFKDIKEIPKIFNTEYQSSKTDPNIFPNNEQMIRLNYINNNNNNLFNFKNINNNINLNIDIDSNKTGNILSLLKNKNNTINTIPNLINSVKENESNKTYHKLIKRIDDKLDINEGGFIKLNNYNLGLLKQKNFVKLQIRNNKRLDIKMINFFKKYEEKERYNLKTSTVKMNNRLNEVKNKNENSFFNIKTMGSIVDPKGKRSKSGNKAKKKIWNFPYVSNFTPKYQDFINFYNNNFKARRTKRSLTRRKLRHEMNEMMEKFEKAFSIKESAKNTKVKEIYSKIVSFKSLNKENKTHNYKKSFNLRNKNMVKELIIMKKRSFQDEGINTYDNQDSININNLSQKKNLKSTIEDTKKDDLIKIMNDKYIDDLFYNNLKHLNKNKNNDIKQLSKTFFKDYYYNKFRSYDKIRMVLYNTGQFDMPLASDITLNDY